MSKRKLRKPVFVTVDQLEPGTKGHNLKLKVLNCDIVVEKKRVNGSTVRIAEGLVGDETGCIIVTAKNDQIDVVQPGSSIIIRNCKIDMFRNHMRIVVDKWGLIEESNENYNMEVNIENNLSEVEYELVPIK
eukprot:TRINITY_DN2958_c0_g1_i1.p1 TRINITY_DN2958_c0_g1~~TRINITY_DN2958_c0_g1_i1.p1  ORF type:complete len:132 (+),score=25.57 TRINITY_DN2958_c0_g1_i1:188-583(+)